MYRVSIIVAAMLISGPASAVPSQSSEQVEAQQAIQEVLEEAAAELLKPGPKREDWSRGGIDIDRLVEAAPGGAKANYLLSIDKDGDRTVSIVGAKTLAAVPPHWSAALEYGRKGDIESSDAVSFSRLDGPYFIVGWEQNRRVGDAFCSAAKMGATLFRSSSSSVKSEIPPELIPAMFNVTARLLEKRTICWRFDRVATGYSTSYFLEDGSTLPALDGFGDITTIVPAAAIDVLLEGRVTGEK